MQTTNSPLQAASTPSKRNPRANVPSGLSPRARSDQKVCSVLALIYNWHVTAAPLVQEHLGTSETNYLVELEKKGLVRHFNCPTLLCGRAYMLTADGLNAAAVATGIERRYSLHPASVSHTLLKHNLAAQRAGIRLAKEGHRVESGRQLSVTIGGKIPDALIYPKDSGKTVAMELELTDKWGDELEQALNAHLVALNNGEWSGVYYASNDQKLLENYKKRLEKPIRDWWQSQSDDRPKWMSGEQREVSDKQQAKFVWHHVPDLLRGFERIYR